MIGRTYSSGFEPDLEDWLLGRPRRTVLNPAWPWAIWYPLRRTGAFAKLSAQEQGAILREHGTIGRAYGDADLAHDIRLACHGLDAHDNDFLIGLVGKELQPLSHLVQAMRKTAQTSEYMASLGPFFVGHAVWQSPPSPMDQNDETLRSLRATFVLGALALLAGCATVPSIPLTDIGAIQGKWRGTITVGLGPPQFYYLTVNPDSTIVAEWGIELAVGHDHR